MIATEYDLKNLKGIIYLFVNKINLKKYVGQTVDTFQERYRNEWYLRASNDHFKNALLKYGQENFIIYILKSNQMPQDLNILEVFYIRFFNSDVDKFGYNKTSGGEDGNRHSKEQFIESAIKVHGNKYSYINSKYITARSKIEIFCNYCSSYFWQNASSHLCGVGCPECGKRKRLEQRTTPIKSLLEKSYELYGNKFFYHVDTYINKKKPIKITVKDCGHTYYQLIDYNLKFGRCKICYHEPHNKLDKKDFIDRANTIHKKEYDYSEIDYINTRHEIKIKHLKCGKIFYQFADSHLRGIGCPHCGRIKTNKSKHKKVLQIDPVSKEVVKEFESIKSVLEYIGIKTHSLKRNIDYLGFEWKVIDDT